MGQEFSSIAFNEDIADPMRGGFSDKQRDAIKYSRVTSRQLYFQKTQGTGEMNPQAFAQLVKLDLFDLFDMDGNGKIDDYEFICGLALFTKTKPNQRLEALFNVFDQDNSQTCDMKEFPQLVETVLRTGSTKDIDPQVLNKKMSEIKGKFFMNSDTVSLADFNRIALDDADLRRCLVDIGMLSNGEIDVSTYSDDLAAELGKYTLEEEDIEGMQSAPPAIKIDGINSLGIFDVAETEQGDQFMAVKPFEGTVRNSVPSDYKPSKSDGDTPSATLKLHYIHGFRCHDTRNNIFYNPDGKLVYHTGLVGIQLDTMANTQKFVVDNVDDIISMDSWGNLSATGDITDKPALVIWDNIQMQSLCVFSGVLRKGIAMLAFSRDGRQLAVSCMDADSSLWIFDVQKLIAGQREKAKITSMKGPKERLLDMKFTPDGQSLICPAKSETYEIGVASGSVSIKKFTGWGPKTANKQPTMCVAFVNGEALIGAFDGKILRARSSNISGVLDGHTACINALYSRREDKGFISGANDGKVIVWDQALTKARTFDLSTVKDIPIMNPRIRAVSESFDGKKIVIGTRSSNIIEVQENGAMKSVNNGHFDNELWGLAVIPRSDEVITAGEDFMVARWNLKERRLIKIKKIPFKSTVCDVSSDGKLVAVGCENGQTIIMNVADFSDVKKIADRMKKVSEIKFSPDCKYLAIGAHDSRIRIYSTNGFKLIGECRGHHSTITHIDWSVASRTIQSNCTSYELLYFDAASCKQNTRGASENRDEKWATWTCVLGWPVQGIFPAYSDGTDVNACSRNKDGTVLATSDDFGTVKLFKYPCPVKKAAFNAYNAHSSHVTNVRFSDKEDFVISTGGNDKALIQWSYRGQGQEEIQAEEEGESNVNMAGFDPSEFAIQESEKGQQSAPPPKPLSLDDPTGMFALEDVGAGDQFMAVKPFEGEVRNSVPTGFKASPRCNDPPEGNLTLKHAFGFRCHDAKDTAKFLESSNRCAFITAALGITMDIYSLQQKFFNKHDEDLVSMDVSPNKQYCATGSMPAKGRSKLLDIYVWDTNTQQQVAFLTGFHKGAVKHLKFSPSGRMLLSVGLDDNNSLAVYDWMSNRMLCNAKVDRSPVFDCAWRDEENFVTITKDSIKFWSIKAGSISATKGVWGKEDRIVLASCIYAKGICFTGSWNGLIIPWTGASKGKPIQAHNGGVFALHYDPNKDLLLSGGKDGMVISWKISGGSLVKTGVVHNYKAAYERDSAGIRAIDSHPDGSYLIGTRDAEIIKIEPNGTLINFMNGHMNGEVWGLACHPKNSQFVTAGGDASVRTYDAIGKNIIELFYHTSDVRAVDWSSDGNFIVAASVIGEIILFDGGLNVLDQVQSSFTKKDQWIEEIKFSPDCGMVAFGAHGGVSPVEVFLVANGKLKKHAIIKIGLTSALLHLDWSTDSNALVANSQAYELKFVNVKSQSIIRASDARDIDWFTWTCKLGFPVQGIFPGIDGTDVNTVCRANNRKVMATGDDFQKVNLFRYPSVMPKSGNKRYTAHSSHVTRVRFMMNDNCLISIGGNDKTACVWTTDFGGDHPLKGPLMSGERGELGGAQTQLDENEILGIVPKMRSEVEVGNQSVPTKPNVTEFADSPFQLEEAPAGDEFMAVKPWLGAIKAPSNFTTAPPNQDKKPNVSITLEYVYGYRARDKRNNIFYLNNGDIAYYAAAVGIVHNVKSNSQIFGPTHRDDILSMSVHPDNATVATGELGPKPMICIWNGLTGQETANIKTGIIKGVDNLKFSDSGKFLAATCMDDDHRVVVYDVFNKYALLATEKGGKDFILGIAWINDSSFVTVGLKHYVCWSFTGNSLKGSKGAPTGSNLLVCISKTPNEDLLVGSATGELQIWKGASPNNVMPLHKGFLDAITVTNNCVLTGGKDAKINILSTQYNKLATIDVYSFAPKTFDGHVRAIAFNPQTNKIAVGTFSSEIYEISVSSLDQSAQVTNSTPVNQGHFAKNKKWLNEVWGLAALEDGDTFLTCSDDGTLRRWSASQRKCIQSMNLNIDQAGVVMGPDPTTKDLRDCSKLRSIAVHPKGGLAAVGCLDGSVRIVKISDKEWKQLGIFRHRTKWIQEMKFSPDGSLLAIGSHDAWINIYEIPSFKLKSKMKKHSSAITHIDWTNDSRFIHSTCNAYELLFFDTNGKQITSGASMLRDEDWATWTATLGWPVQGIWRSEMDGSDINMVDRSTKTFDSNYRLLACAEDTGLVRLYRYPCLKKNSDFEAGRGHSSHVTNVRFNKSDTYIYSTGGEDQTVMQWRIGGGSGR